MMDRPTVRVALFRARVAILIVWHIIQICAWLLAHLAVLGGVLILIVVLGIPFLKSWGCLLGIL
jgi:hypothetical protein